MLRGFDHRHDWYLGKPSIAEPLEILDREEDRTAGVGGGEGSGRISFWFGTGGAGFCLSRSLADRMAPAAGGGRLAAIGNRIRLPDDVTVGYVADHLLGVPLTVIDTFHSHLEPQRFAGADLESQISLSYSKYGEEDNVVPVAGPWPAEDDPTRFLSLHCMLFPRLDLCSQAKGSS